MQTAVITRIVELSPQMYLLNGVKHLVDLFWTTSFPSPPVTQRVFLSPRNATVLVGGTYSLECGGTQRVYPSSLYTFLDQSYRMVTLGTYVYPQPGFPVYQVENVTPDHDANCFFCQFGPNAIGLGVISTYTNKAFLTVHCEFKYTSLADWLIYRLSVDYILSQLYLLSRGCLPV